MLAIYTLFAPPDLFSTRLHTAVPWQADLSQRTEAKLPRHLASSWRLPLEVPGDQGQEGGADPSSRQQWRLPEVQSLSTSAVRPSGATASALSRASFLCPWRLPTIAIPRRCTLPLLVRFPYFAHTVRIVFSLITPLECATFSQVNEMIGTMPNACFC